MLKWEKNAPSRLDSTHDALELKDLPREKPQTGAGNALFEIMGAIADRQYEQFIKSIDNPVEEPVLVYCGDNSDFMRQNRCSVLKLSLLH